MTTEGKYTIKSLSITGLRNRGAADINYSANSTSDLVTYSGPTVDGKFFGDITQDIVMEHGFTYDLLGSSAIAVPSDGFTPTFKLLWPLTKEQVQEIRITGTYVIDGNVDELGNPIESPIDVSLTMDGTTYSPWKAGHKYQYSLVFSDKAVTLVYSVLPWDYVKTDIDFADHSLSATALRLEGGTQSGNNYLVSTTANTIVGSFQIWTPVGAIWRVSMKGDTEFFTLEDNQGTIDPTQDNGLVSFRIVPNTAVKAANPGITAKITLHFSVETSSGEELNGNTEINRDNIQIVY